MRKLLPLVVALALFAAACSGAGATVATVNGSVITLEEVEEIRLGGSVANRDQFNQDMFQLIVEEAVRQAASEDFGIVADQAEIDARFNEFIAGIEAQSPVQEYLDDNGITEETIRHVAFQQVMLPEIQDRLAAEAGALSPEDLQAAYDAALPSLSTVCTRHILVATEEEANDVVDRLASGEEFADLAGELSLDSGSGAAGGDIGCIPDPAANLVASYAAASLEAEIGEVTGPVLSEFGYHVLIVDSREVPTFDEVSADLEANLLGQQAGLLFDEWVFAVLTDADIVVAERYGTWQTEPTFGVTSPA